MDNSRFKINVVRVLSQSTTATWPDDYPGLTLAEAVASEQDNVRAVELLGEQGKLSTTVTSTELTED